MIFPGWGCGTGGRGFDWRYFPWWYVVLFAAVILLLWKTK